VEDVKLVLFRKKKTKENGFQPATILRRRIFTHMKCDEIGNFHPVLFIRISSGSRVWISIHYRLVMVW
jgi:hypothetical protein